MNFVILTKTINNLEILAVLQFNLCAAGEKMKVFFILWKSKVNFLLHLLVGLKNDFFPLCNILKLRKKENEAERNFLSLPWPNFFASVPSYSYLQYKSINSSFNIEFRSLHYTLIVIGVEMELNRSKAFKYSEIS